jgi:dTDP-4-dehydrorhamnose reductase
MHLPLRFPGNGWLNLVPINFLVKAVTAIMESGETGIFHIVNPKSDTIGQLAQYIEKHYAISGLDIADQAAHDSPLQILINSYMDVYYPYFCDKRRFSDYRTRKILEPLGIECPELTSAVFKRCMDFAEKASWGSKIRV